MLKKYAVPLFLIMASILIILAGWANYLFLQHGSQELLAAVEQAKLAAEQEDWAKAASDLNRITTVWRKVEKYWPMLIHHEEMDRIEESMNKLKSYIRYEDTTQTMAELYNLNYYIRHIPEKEVFNLQNIF